MGCCKCVEYKWSDPQEVVWEDPTDGSGYCIFHAPKGKKFRVVGGKEVVPAEFNDLIFARVRCAVSNAVVPLQYVTCTFCGTIFPFDITFSEFNEYRSISTISFNSCIFHGITQFNEVYFLMCDFSNAIFIDRAEFVCARFHDIAAFSSTRFEDSVEMHEAIFCKSVEFDNAYFGNIAKFHYVEFHGRAMFYGIQSMPHQVIFDSISESSFRNIDFNFDDIPAFLFRTCRTGDIIGPDHFNAYAGALPYVEQCYRAMKQRAAEEHDQPLVSRWHFREKLMQLKQLFNNERSNNLIEVVEDRDAKWRDRAKAWFKLLWQRPHWPKLTLTGIYWATSGFGERAVRAGVWLLALVALSFLANSIKEPWVWAELPGSAAAGYTMATIPFAKDIPGDGWVKVGRGFWQLLIAVQFTLFALAVRNRFRR